MHHTDEVNKENERIKMKFAIALCVFGFAAVALADLYTDRYDNVKVDDILGNKRLLEPYILCGLDKGKCTPDGKELKDNIAEALENYCAKCTEVQKKGTRKVIKHLIKNEAAYWNELSAKYDPEGKYKSKYEKELSEVTA